MSYDDVFFDYVDSGSVRSAEIVVKSLMPEIEGASVLDVGCGRGAWVKCWKEAGCPDVTGIDGDYVDRSRLFIDESEFKTVDLNRSFDLGRKFDIVQSLEVGEHLKPASSTGFVDSIVRHGDVILFSSAVPGQGGTQHINEKPIEFWKRLFASHGYHSFDYLRPIVRHNKEVEPWYRYNTILYANDTGLRRLSDSILRTRVQPSDGITEMGSLWWKIRRIVLRRLSVEQIDRLAAINAKRRLRTSYWSLLRKS